ALMAVILFSRMSFANEIPPSKEKCVKACRDFTVEVGIGIFSVSTTVTVCAESNGYGSWNVWLERQNNNGVDITSAINANNKSSSNIEQVTILSSSSEVFEDGKTYTIQEGIYDVEIRNGKYYIDPILITN